MNQNNFLLEAQGIVKNYGALQVLKGVSVQVKKAEVIALTGASGAGKSTLLHLLGALDRADAGTIAINGKILNELSENELAAFRNRHMGFVFQFHHLLPEFTAIENICIPALIGGTDEKTAVERAVKLLAMLNMSHRGTHKPGELSGGEQQRVAVARALINQPDLVFADEPSGNLDSANASELHQLFFRLREELGQTFVIVTHNESLSAMADRVITMKDGRISS